MARYRDEEEDLDTAPVDDSGMPDSTKSKAALLKGARGPTGPTGVAGASGDFNPDSPYSNATTRWSYLNPPSMQSDEFYFAAAEADTPPVPAQAAAPQAAAPQAAAPQAADPVGAVSPQPAVAPAAPAQNFFDYLPDKDERGFSALPEAKTYDQATERVSFFEQTGQDMKALVARQDPLFKDAFARQAQTGKSTSPLMLGGQPSGGIERRRASREEREADRTKDPAVARALRASAAQRRASQPSIRTPQDKRQEMEKGMQLRDAIQDTVEMGQQAAGGAVAKESTLGTSDGKGLSNGYRLGTTAKGGVGASAPLGDRGGKTENKKKTGALAYRDDDKLLGMSDGISTYQYSRLAPLQIMLQDLKSRRA